MKMIILHVYVFLSIQFVTDNADAQRALLRKYGCRDCSVRLDELPALLSEITPPPPPKVLLTKNKIRGLQSNVSWLPEPISIQMNSTENLSSLAEYHNDNSIVPPIFKKNIKIHRNKTILAKSTIATMHSEYLAKISLPNKGLRPITDRQLNKLQLQPLSTWEKLKIELKAKVDAKKST